MTQISASDLIAQQNNLDPYTFYQRLREQGPLFSVANYMGTGRAWIATNYEDAIAILKDPRLIKNKPVSQQETLMSIFRRNMLMVDPPDHTRLRSLVSKGFTPRMIEQLRPRIQQITDELLDAVQHQGKMDLISDFAFLLPVTVICEMLGIPTTDRQLFRTWMQATPDVGAEPGQEATTSSTIEGMLNYFKALLNEKRVHPGNDLISSLIRVEENADALSELELLSMIWLLFVAGHETTVNLIGNGTLALLRHPEQLRRLQNDPALIVSAVEELLRYTAPVSLSDRRWASEDIRMHGNLIRTGEIVLVSLLAVNADPQQFHDPETLNIIRQENQHLAFGKGIHYCLGAPLARLEGQIAFGTLLRRLPNVRMACAPEQLVWNNDPMLRGLVRFPVEF
jgi:cytochrome P450